MSSEGPLQISKSYRYKNARDSFCQRIEDGTCTWYGRGMGHANDFSFNARIAWNTGLVSSPFACTRMIDNILNEITLQLLSTEASTRKLEEAQSYFPTTSTETDGNSAISVTINLEDDTEDDSGSESYCTAPELEEVIAVCNLWPEMPKQPLAQELQVEQNPWASRSTASLLDKRRGVVPSTSRQKPQHQPGPWVVRVPTANSMTDSEVVSNVDLEDDAEDDSGSDSNGMAREEVEAVYDLWREKPEQPTLGRQHLGIKPSFFNYEFVPRT